MKNKEARMFQNSEILKMVESLINRISLDFSSRTTTHLSELKVYGVPRGGLCVAYLMSHVFTITDSPDSADFIVDDVIDSGTTAHSFSVYPVPFYALIDKRELQSTFHNKWLVFPWENTVESSIEGNIQRIIQYIEPDPNRQGLAETPARVARAWNEWTSGYLMNPSDVFKTFEDGSENYDQMIVVKDINFYSQCEHHMAPFFGTVSIGYIPDGKVLGLSKFPRLVDIFSKRLQVQERLTRQISEEIQTNLKPKGCAVYVKARHLCMESRGICKHGNETITTAISGIFQDQPAVKTEFLNYLR